MSYKIERPKVNCTNHEFRELTQENIKRLHNKGIKRIYIPSLYPPEKLAYEGDEPTRSNNHGQGKTCCEENISAIDIVNGEYELFLHDGKYFSYEKITLETGVKCIIEEEALKKLKKEGFYTAEDISFM